MTNLRKLLRASTLRVTHWALALSRHRWRWSATYLQRFTRRWRSLGRLQQWLAASVVIGLVVFACAYAAISGHSHSPIDNGTNRRVANADPAIKNFTPAHRSSSSDTPETAVAAMHVPRALASALKKWDNGPGGTALANVSGDLAAATQASGIRLFGPMLQACSSLANAIMAAKSAPPMPDASMQGLYSRALARLAAAATKCRSGLSQYPTEDEGLQTRANAPVVHQADLELAAGAKYLYQATVEINAARSRALG
jgi:hypothetical protein